MDEPAGRANNFTEEELNKMKNISKEVSKIPDICKIAMGYASPDSLRYYRIIASKGIGRDNVDKERDKTQNAEPLEQKKD